MKHYEAVYEPMDEEELSWIKLINCGKRVEINNIHGFLLGRIVQFLANMHNTVHSIYLSRHGQSMYNREGKIGGDSPLSPAGEAYAHALADYVGQNMCRDAAGDLVRARCVFTPDVLGLRSISPFASIPSLPSFSSPQVMDELAEAHHPNRAVHPPPSVGAPRRPRVGAVRAARDAQPGRDIRGRVRRHDVRGDRGAIP